MRRRPHWLLLLLGACAGPGPLGPPSELVVRIAAGDNQEGPGREYAPLTLVVEVEDAAGRPVAGRPVVWDDPVNGRVVALNARTSANGRAEALFVFGDADGPGAVSASVSGAAPARFHHRTSGRGWGVPYDSMTLLPFGTYEGSGETVHPDYARTPWPGLGNLLAITPYPGGDAVFENPSLFVARSPFLWPAPPGTANPLVAPPAGAYHSDPDLVYVPDARELWLYYRLVDGQNRILVIRSGDGIRWTAPREVASASNHRLISPAVVYRGPGDWWMWSVNGGKLGCSGADSHLELRRSMDGLHWGPPAPAPIAHDGLTPWHVDVQWIPSRSEFWAVYNAKPPGSCATPALFLATSPDGVVWTPVRRPLVRQGVIPEFADVVYRATFRFEPGTDDLWLWVSGASHIEGTWVWRTGLERVRAGAALDAAPPSAAFRARPARAALTEWP